MLCKGQGIEVEVGVEITRVERSMVANLLCGEAYCLIKNCGMYGTRKCTIYKRERAALFTKDEDAERLGRLVTEALKYE